MRRIAMSGLVALAAVLGGVGLPAAAGAQAAAAGAQSTAAIAQPTAAGQLAGARLAARPATSPYGDGFINQGPLVSCVLGTDCLGVEGISGLSGGQTATSTRIARWNGSGWKGVGVTLPTGAKLVDLNAVSCRSPRSCVVVGDYYKSASGTAVYPLALVYNGTSVRPGPIVPLPKGMPDGALTGVSCVTAAHCVAVGMASETLQGFSLGGPEPVIETWNGRRWTLRTLTTPAAGKTVDFAGVSCATTAFCVITGTTERFSGSNFSTNLYLASWNGERLRVVKPPLAGGSSNLPQPVGVSCATPSSCAVTGAVMHLTSEGTSGFTPFTLVWNGRAWRTAPVTWPKGVGAALLMGVSCFRALACKAVGAIAPTAAAQSSAAAAVSYRGIASAFQSIPSPARGCLGSGHRGHGVSRHRGH